MCGTVEVTADTLAPGQRVAATFPGCCGTMDGMQGQCWIMGHGYEGRTIAQYVEDLCVWQVDVVVDVRLNAISRKKGFSKTALRETLAEAGIRYEHRPELGNPKDNRAGFWEPGTADHRHAVSRFAASLAGASSADALRELADMATEQRVMLLCFEADERCCHRRVVLDQVKQLVAARELADV